MYNDIKCPNCRGSKLTLIESIFTYVEIVIKHSQLS